MSGVKIFFDIVVSDELEKSSIIWYINIKNHGSMPKLGEKKEKQG